MKKVNFSIGYYTRKLRMSIEFDVQPITSNKAIRSLYTELLESGELILRPAYQRNVVWSDAQKSYLIKSIMDGCPMPLFLFYTFLDVNECVDGQNRCDTIKKYIEQKNPTRDQPDIPFPWIKEDGDKEEYVFYPNEDVKIQEWFVVQNASHTNKKKSRTYRFMTLFEKKRFNGYQLAIQFITTELSFEQRQEIFKRWQMGSPIGQCDRIKNEGYPFCEFVLEQRLEHTLYESVLLNLKPRLKSQERSNWLWDVYRVLNVFFQPLNDKVEDIIISTLKCRTLITNEKEEEFQMDEWVDAVRESNDFLGKVSSISKLNKTMKITMLLTLAYLWKKGTRDLFDRPDLIQRVEKSLKNTAHSTLNNENQTRAYLLQFTTVVESLLG